MVLKGAKDSSGQEKALNKGNLEKFNFSQRREGRKEKQEHQV